MPGLTSFVITVLGPDKPGLVETISSAVVEHGGNWIESRMAHLSGQFAGIIHVTVSPDRAADLQSALERLKGQDLAVNIQGEEDTQGPPSQAVTLELIGPDRPGIVREIAHAFAGRGVNVEELETECVSAPMSGEPLFRATALLTAPDDRALEALRGDLESIANQLTLEIDLVAPVPVT